MKNSLRRFFKTKVFLIVKSHSGINSSNFIIVYVPIFPSCYNHIKDIRSFIKFNTIKWIDKCFYFKFYFYSIHSYLSIKLITFNFESSEYTL